ncbi:MAG TPA: oxidoreductase [Verrucomicrobia bacterium]|nr:oxidoreductase [Verrucomicrobiota bacterium]
MTNAKLRTGVIGVGSLGQWHARIYSEMADVELTGVYDADPARAREIAERYHTQAFDTVEQLAAQVEAVSIVVPTNLHFDVFQSVVPFGVHVLVEKPIATSYEEAEAMVQQAGEKDILLQVGHVERFNPVMTFLSDNLTHARFIEATRLASYPPPREGAPPRGTEVSVVLDLMIHDLDIILRLANSPVKAVHATGVAVLSPTEDIANARIQFENGCVANVTASRISQDKLRKIRVFQDDTYLSLDYMTQAGQLCRRSATGIEALEVPIDKSEPLAAELRSFVDCVRRRSDPVVTGRHGMEALQLAMAICQTIRERPS